MGILRTNTVSGLETPTPVTGSVSFDGSGGTYLSAGSSSDFAFATGAFTIEAWINIPANVSERNIVSTRGTAGTVNGWSFSIQESSGRYGLTFYSNFYIFNNVGSIPLNTWTHIALVREGIGTNQTKIYINGLNVGTTTNTSNFTNTTLGIGNANDGTQFPYSGYISNLRVLKGTALYTENFTPPTRELQPIGDTVLLCCNNPDSAGAEATGKTITVNGNATASTFSPGLVRDFTYGTQFDGVSRFDTQGYFVPPSGNTQNRYTLGLDEIVTDGLVLHLDAGNPFSYPVTGVGTKWTDLSGNNNHGTLVNGVSYTENNRGALVFDGVDDYVNCGDLDITTNNITLSCWFRGQNNANGSSAKRLISKDNSYLLQYDSSTDEYQSTIVLYSGGVYYGVSNPNILYSNIWYNLVGTYDGSSMKIYTNGVLSNVRSISLTISQDNNNLEIGGDSINGYNHTGNISQVQIYNKALTAQEVLQNYEALKGRYGHS